MKTAVLALLCFLAITPLVHASNTDITIVASKAHPPLFNAPIQFNFLAVSKFPHFTFQPTNLNFNANAQLHGFSPQIGAGPNFETVAVENIHPIMPQIGPGLSFASASELKANIGPIMPVTTEMPISLNAQITSPVSSAVFHETQLPSFIMLTNFQPNIAPSGGGGIQFSGSIPYRILPTAIIADCRSCEPVIKTVNLNDYYYTCDP